MTLFLIYSLLFRRDFLNFRIIVELGKRVSVPIRYSLNKYFLLFSHNLGYCALNMKDIRLGVLFIYRYLSLYMFLKLLFYFLNYFFMKNFTKYEIKKCKRCNC